MTAPRRCHGDRGSAAVEAGVAVTSLLLVGFFIVHIVMIFAAGPLNELRSIITGWYRVDAKESA